MNQKKLTKVLELGLKRAGYSPDAKRVASLLGDLEMAFAIDVDDDQPGGQSVLIQPDQSPFPGQVYSDVPEAGQTAEASNFLVADSNDSEPTIVRPPTQYEEKSLVVAATEIPKLAKLPAKSEPSRSGRKIELNLHASPRGAGIEDLISWVQDNANFPARIQISPRGRQAPMIINRYMTPMYAPQGRSEEDCSGVIISYRNPDADESVASRVNVMTADIRNGFPDPGPIMSKLAAQAIISHGVMPSRIEGAEPTGPGLFERAGIGQHAAHSIARMGQDGNPMYTGVALDVNPRNQKVIQANVPREVNAGATDKTPQFKDGLYTIPEE